MLFRSGSSLTSFDIQATREAASSFSAKSVKASIDGGKTLNDVYVESKKAHGSAKTQRVVRAFLDGLKKSGARINLAAVDCSLLKNRLTASETILGKPKCASCTLRGGMHCGFTGGTILSFPGMETTGAKRASMATPGQDGVALMDAMELKAPELVIDIKEDRKLQEVEMPSIPTVSF